MGLCDVFDDKQRITYDHDVNGDFDTSFPIGHQIFGESVFEAVFQSNGGLQSLTAGQQLRGVNAGGIIETRAVNFNTTTGNDAYVNGRFDFVQVSGSVDAGETLVLVVLIQRDFRQILLTHSTLLYGQKIMFIR